VIHANYGPEFDFRQGLRCSGEHRKDREGIVPSNVVHGINYLVVECHHSGAQSAQPFQLLHDDILVPNESSPKVLPHEDCLQKTPLRFRCNAVHDLVLRRG